MPMSLTRYELDFPLSPVFIDFVARYLDGTGPTERWFEQTSEHRSKRAQDCNDMATPTLQRLLCDGRATAILDRAFMLFHELLQGAPSALESIHERFQFIAIIGAPRTGGSYLTGELFRALGYTPSEVPSAVAHDGFPEARPFTTVGFENSWHSTLTTTAEYLAMVELFFGNQNRKPRSVVPKKLIKAIYASGFFKSVLGRRAEYLITIRHPITSCISTYEKSGGLPQSGRFTARSVIETWIRRDLQYFCVSAQDQEQEDYFRVYLRYWENFYISLATSGWLANRDFCIVPYGASNMESIAGGFHSRFGGVQEASRFFVRTGLAARHPAWRQPASEAIDRVASLWSAMGLRFPASEIAECL